MQCHKWHQGFTSHGAGRHCLMEGPAFTLWKEKALQISLGSVLFPLLKSVFWCLRVMGAGGVSWGATSSPCRSLGPCPASQTLEADMGEALLPPSGCPSCSAWSRGGTQAPAGAECLLFSFTSPIQWHYRPLRVIRITCHTKAAQWQPVSASGKADVKETMRTKWRGAPGEALTFISSSLGLGDVCHRVYRVFVNVLLKHGIGRIAYVWV